ncbi:hypothetical protein CDAR_497111 [Caerostris darwini]|uniref:Uncharacterized protein n=1 Tax=Caerostris darwini TaxID=1538125 RepID=A0AAV4S0P0_9ARAC|nr:hypothetical protein CDAR_497111 [Caerostris darwini]
MPHWSMFRTAVMAYTPFEYVYNCSNGVCPIGLCLELQYWSIPHWSMFTIAVLEYTPLEYVYNCSIGGQWGMIHRKRLLRVHAPLLAPLSEDGGAEGLQAISRVFGLSWADPLFVPRLRLAASLIS